MYQEVQHFSAKMIFVITSLVIIPYAVSLMFFTPFDVGLDAFLKTFWVLPLLLAIFCFIRLKTKVVSQQLDIQFAWAFGEKIDLKEIKAAEAVTYRPLRDFGGWGIRYGRLGKIYNIAGNKAVKLTLSSGRTLFVGSAQPDELVAAIRG